jgi:purine nucleosidase
MLYIKECPFLVKPSTLVISEEKRLTWLQPPAERPIELVLDTDAKNEIDDQFAIVYALTSDHLKCQAIYAAPFRNQEYPSASAGMEGSYQEIKEILQYMRYPCPPPVLRGSESFITDTDEPKANPAVEDLIARSLRSEKLYVVAIGALTNIAAALLMEPKIAEHMVLVWLGGQPENWITAREFNLSGDLQATRIVFNSGIPIVRIPCKNVAEHVRCSPVEITEYIGPCGEIGAYLSKIFTDSLPGKLRSRVIWDLVPLAWLVNPKWVPSRLIPTPSLSDEQSWDTSDAGRPVYRVAIHAWRDPIMLDFTQSLENYIHTTLDDNLVKERVNSD